MPPRSPRSKTPDTSVSADGAATPKAAEKAAPAKRPVRRRDAPGHIDPRYARELLAKARETRNDDAKPENTHAFLKGSRTSESLAQELGRTSSKRRPRVKSARPSVTIRSPLPKWAVPSW